MSEYNLTAVQCSEKGEADVNAGGLCQGQNMYGHKVGYHTWILSQ